jgi:DNA modification methylase
MRPINLEKCPLVELPIEQAKPYENNARLHSELQLSMLEASFRRFRVMSPILISSDREVIAGHARLIVAKRVGLNTITAIVLPHLNATERKAFRIADNAIALRGEWSIELLSAEIDLISSLDLDFNPIEIGFETGEIDSLTLAVKDRPNAAPAAHEPDRTAPATSRVGDMFRIGRHLVVCGDSKDPMCFSSALNGRRVAAVISDQPWNLPANFISGNGSIRHPDFVECSGEKSDDEFRTFTERVLANQAQCCAPGALVFQFIDWRSVDVMVRAGKKCVGDLVNICVWVKQCGGLGSLWRSGHEFVCVFRAPGGKSKNNVQLGRHGRTRSNVWQYDSPRGFGAERAKLKLHPTCKNQTMIADAILDCTDRNDVVLDAFLGSGTTILAAHETGRIGVGIELDGYYVDLAVARIAEATGERAVCQDGRTFEEVRAERAADRANPNNE